MSISLKLAIAKGKRRDQRRRARSGLSRKQARARRRAENCHLASLALTDEQVNYVHAALLNERLRHRLTLPERAYLRTLLVQQRSEAALRAQMQHPRGYRKPKAA